MRKDGLEVVKFANQINNTELHAVIRPDGGVLFIIRSSRSRI